MKIIEFDSLGRGGESPGRDDILVAENITYAKYARAMCNELMLRFSGPGATRCFTVVEDSYKLREFKP